MGNRVCHGFTYRNPHDAHFDEVTASVRERTWNPSPGIAFARKERTPKIRSESDKAEARSKVAEAFHTFSRNLNRPMRVLTMPGMFWKFERLLSGMNRCEYYSTENDPAIYRSSIRYMPGFNHHDGIHIVDNSTIISKFVYEYKFMEVERYIALSEHRFDCAWLDYNGFITTRKLHALRTLFGRTDLCLSITLMEARFGMNSTEMIKRHGSIENWLSEEIKCSPFDVFRYADPTPMVQIIWKRTGA